MRSSVIKRVWRFHTRNPYRLEFAGSINKDIHVTPLGTEEKHLRTTNSKKFSLPLDKEKVILDKNLLVNSASELTQIDNSFFVLYEEVKLKKIVKREEGHLMLKHMLDHHRKYDNLTCDEVWTKEVPTYQQKLNVIETSEKGIKKFLSNPFVMVPTLLMGGFVFILYVAPVMIAIGCSLLAVIISLIVYVYDVLKNNYTK